VLGLVDVIGFKLGAELTVGYKLVGTVLGMVDMPG